jgi:hypothetical protein
MPTFKPKTAKKIKFNKKSSITLDGKHKEFLNEFSKDENDKIPELKLERQELKNKLNNDSLTVDERLDCQDRINEITQTIKEIKISR